MRAFRFSVQCSSPQAVDARSWRELARRCEGLGYHSLTVSDHLDEQLGPGPALMAAADATTTLRIGAMVFCNDFRHPVALAKEAATLDVLSEGRFELGLGADTPYTAAAFGILGVPEDVVEKLADLQPTPFATAAAGFVDYVVGDPEGDL